MNLNEIFFEGLVEKGKHQKGMDILLMIGGVYFL